LGALVTESEDLFCDYKDAFDLVLGGDGGGGREIYFLRADEEGGGDFYFVEADEDGGRGGKEEDFCFLGGDREG
jgi:hypothetical protein